MSATPPEVSTTTLTDLLDALARFSAEGPGVTRLAYDAHWRAGHRWLAERATSFGLAAAPDAAGNLFFHPPSVTPGDLERAVLLVGSHLDSVKHGGRFDGPLGAVTGLLLAGELRKGEGLPVVGFVTCEEEGSRFSECFLGARSLLGQVRHAELDSTRDHAGVTWRQALEEVRAHGGAAPLAPGEAPFVPLFKPALMLELHIEQGPVLESEGLQLGIVEHIAGYRRWKAVLTGEARHTGTTPAAMKRDALAAAAAVIADLEALAADSGEPTRAAAGNIAVAPGLFNVVAERCELWIEIRHVEAATLEALARELDRRSRAVAERRGVTLSLQEISRQEPTALAPALVQTAARLASEMGIAHRRMVSGAAHDTMVFARSGVPSLLVFVPSRRGISHSPEEFTSPEQIWTGYRFMRELCARLSRSRGAP